MKKYIYLSICLILLFSFLGCKKKEKEEKVSVTIVYGRTYDDVKLQVIKGNTIQEPEYIEEEYAKLISFNLSNGNKFDFSSEINEDITIYAEWDITTFTYTFYDYDGSIYFQKVDEGGSNIEYPENPTREPGEGYVWSFKKWNNDSIVLVEDEIFRPVYERIYEKVNCKFYDIDKTTVLKDVMINYGDSIGEPKYSEPQKQEGYAYRFDGWYDYETDHPCTIPTEIKEDICVYAKFKQGKITEKPLEDCVISFLGASRDTYYDAYSPVNSLYHGKDQYYYPTYSSTVLRVSDTWWYQTYTGLNIKLGVNNSYSGSCASDNTMAGNSVARLKTLGNNGIPNIVVVILGANDNVNGYSAEKVYKAYCTIIEYITEHYIEFDGDLCYIPQIYMFNEPYTSYRGYSFTDERRLEYNQKMDQVASEYDNVKVFYASDVITKDNYTLYYGDQMHYNADGMKVLSNALIEKIKNDFKKEN